MKLGMTATRKGFTNEQYVWMGKQIAAADELHHGACIGGDEAGHHIARSLGVPIVVHPPLDEKLMMEFDDWDYENCVWFPAAQYHQRNREIIGATDYLAAGPDSKRRPHSGTWYTIDYAEQVGKPVLICYPDGRVVDIQRKDTD